MSICILDTSIFVNILDVPRKADQRDNVISELKKMIKSNTTLLLPLATIVETGNHIAQNGNGNQRRECAVEFVRQVRAAFDGSAPWQPTSFPDIEEMKTWLGEFPDHAKASTGFADLSIIKEWEKVCTQNQAQRVFIWSLDGDLQGYNRAGA